MSDQKETIDQTSDAEIFEEATSEMPSPVPTPSETSPVETSEDKPGRLAGRKRDEKGRVLPKEAEPEPEPVVEATPQPEPEKPSHQVPLTELLNERERRQNEQRQREALQHQLQALQRQLQEQQKPPEQVDIFADPATWEQTLQQRNEAWRRQVMGEMSLRLASAKYPDEFQSAYTAMQQRLASGDTALQQAFIASPDPGEMMVNWYRKERTAQVVGSDPEDFLARALDAALENPEFLARAVEKARGTASTKPTQVKLPPSLSKATASSADTGNTDNSDSAIYDAAWR